MSFFHKYNKGQYEYAAYNKKMLMIFTAFLYLLSAAIYIMGIVTTGSNKNLLTVVAVLGVLPASKLLISVIMACRVKICSTSLKDEIDSIMNSRTGFYHLYFTSYDENYEIVHSVVTADSYIGYTETKDFDHNKFEQHLEKHMKIDGINNMLIKIFDTCCSISSHSS